MVPAQSPPGPRPFRGLLGPAFALISAAMFPLGASGQSWTIQCSRNCNGVDTCDEPKQCWGQEVQSIPCTNGTEPCRCRRVDCSFHPWSDWEKHWECTGLTRRNRTVIPNQCGGNSCTGTLTESKFKIPPCHCGNFLPVACKFATWADWTGCDGFDKQRMRTRFISVPAVNNGADCSGALEETHPCSIPKEDKDCSLTDWLDWSTCVGSCGVGQTMRRREIKRKAQADGEACRGKRGGLTLSETRACKITGPATPCGGLPSVMPHEAVVDCLAGHWTDWGFCMLGQNYRTRQIETHSSGGGTACNQSLSEVLPCSTDNKLPINCRYSEWSHWNLCNADCDGGQTFRDRTIETEAMNGGIPCGNSSDLWSTTTHLKQTMRCNWHPCELQIGRNCHASAWSEWDATCRRWPNITCGEGHRTRTRRILEEAHSNGLGCNFGLSEVKPCQDKATDSKSCMECKWADWTSWTNCSAPCDGGQQTRDRQVLRLPMWGKDRSGKEYSCDAKSGKEIQSCNTKNCSSNECFDGKWEAWSSWSKCSMSCSGGERFRHRNIAHKASACGKEVEGNSSEFETCNADVDCALQDVDCELHDWSKWSACTCTCNGIMHRSRTIKTFGRGLGAWCGESTTGGGLREYRPCNLGEKHCGAGHSVNCELSDWTLADSCNTKCGGGQEVRKRHIGTFPKFGGKPCEGNVEDTRPCNTQPCASGDQDCKFEAWSDWGLCTKCGGQQMRLRSIEHHPIGAGKPCTDGRESHASMSQTKACTSICELENDEFVCVWAEWEEPGSCSVTCGPGTKIRKRNLHGLKYDDIKDKTKKTYGSVKEKSACNGEERWSMDCTVKPCEKPTSLNCRMDSWTDWSPANCDGLCLRNRSVSQNSLGCGEPCEAAVMKMSKACADPNCGGPQDCKLSPWTVWTDCAYRTVGTDFAEGQRFRHRTVEQEGTYTGKSCTGIMNMTEACGSREEEEKSIDCEFVDWEDWTPCSSTCDGGTQKRSRDNKVKAQASGGGEPCKGFLSQIRHCIIKKCEVLEKVDCVLSDWAEWSACPSWTADWGVKQAYRSRILTQEAKNGGWPCQVSMGEMKPCDSKPAVCSFKDWTEWGDCDAKCRGQRYRFRVIDTGSVRATECTLPDRATTAETEKCGAEVCGNASEVCLWGMWQEWGTCNPSCGDGVQLRARQIDRPGAQHMPGCQGSSKMVRGCTKSANCPGVHDCKWGSWGNWSTCHHAENCGVGYKERNRAILIKPTAHGLRCSAKVEREVQPDSRCNLCMECTDGVWGAWSVWGQCAGAVQKRVRAEAIQPNDCGKPLVGDRVQFQQCPQDNLDCMFGAWSAFTARCSKTCFGHVTRTRSIYMNATGLGKPCVGGLAEQSPCNPSFSRQAPPHCEKLDDGTYKKISQDCHVTEWTVWSACSTTCDTGYRIRNRTVDMAAKMNGKPCPPILQQVGQCPPTVPCEKHQPDCRWGVWEDWNLCGKDRQRNRERARIMPVNSTGRDCEGIGKETATCPPCVTVPMFCAWSEWLDWSQCSLTCGSIGRLTRKRVLTLGSHQPAGDTWVAVFLQKDTEKKTLYDSLDKNTGALITSVTVGGLTLAKGYVLLREGAMTGRKSLEALKWLQPTKQAPIELHFSWQVGKSVSWGPSGPSRFQPEPSGPSRFQPPQLFDANLPSLQSGETEHHHLLHAKLDHLEQNRLQDIGLAFGAGCLCLIVVFGTFSYFGASRPTARSDSASGSVEMRSMP